MRGYSPWETKRARGDSAIDSSKLLFTIHLKFVEGSLTRRSAEHAWESEIVCVDRFKR